MTEQDRPHVDVTKVENIIHHHLNSTRIFNSTFDHLLLFLQPDPFANEDPITASALESALAQPLAALTATVNRLLSAIGQDTPLSTQRGVDRLNAAGKTIARAREHLDANSVHAIGEAGAIISDVIGQFRATRVPVKHEYFKDITRHTNDVLRICCLYDLRIAKQMTDSSNYELRIALRHLRGEQFDEFSSIHEVHPVVEQLIEHWRPIAASRNIQVEFTSHTDDARVAAPLRDLNTAISNLLDNAIKYTGRLHHTSKHDHLWIRVILRSTPHTVSLAIESWGTPLTEEEVRNGTVFEHGRRGHFVNTAQTPGSGTGLHFAKEFAINHGGDIHIDTTPVHVGGAPVPMTTTFTLILPRR